MSRSVPTTACRDGRAAKIASPIVGFALRTAPNHGMPYAAPIRGDHCTASAASAAEALVITTAGASERRVAAHTNSPLANAAKSTAARCRSISASGLTAMAAVSG